MYHVYFNLGLSIFLDEFPLFQCGIFAYSYVMKKRHIYMRVSVHTLRQFIVFKYQYTVAWKTGGRRFMQAHNKKGGKNNIFSFHLFLLYFLLDSLYNYHYLQTSKRKKIGYIHRLLLNSFYDPFQ